MQRLRLGTRGSPLALAQAHMVAAAIEAVQQWPHGHVEIVTVTTTGDKVQDRPLADVGGKAVWTKELDRALLSGEVDLCVHSMKDVESVRPEELSIAAVLHRADVRDRIIGAESIAALKPEAVVGTSSPRRAAQLRRLRPDLNTAVIRGNVETRLRKVEEGEFDATLLAAAGLDRLGIAVGAPIPADELLPAPAQAVIGIECLTNDGATRDILGTINDWPTFDCAMAERALTRALGGTCHSPIAALCTLDGEGLRLRAQLFSEDGREMVEGERSFDVGDAATPEALARELLHSAPDSIRKLFGA